MTTGDRAAPHFDEKAALDELERLQQAIVESRRRRGETIDEFDAWVRSFRRGSDRVVERDTSPAPRETQAPARETPPPPIDVPRPEHETAFDPVPPAASIPAPQIAPEAADPVPVAQGRRLSVSTWVVAGAVVAVVLSAAILRRGSSPANETPPQTSAAPPPTQQPHAPAAAAATVPVKTGGIQAEIVTLRPVWIRVLADGRKTVERELKADTHLPIHAEQSIVIRAGDAGALRVSIGGQDQGPLGRDGIVATRTFTAKPPR
jgi:hypothetical protein